MDAEHRAALFSDHSGEDALGSLRHMRVILPLSDNGDTVDRLLVGLEPVAPQRSDTAPCGAAAG